MAKKRISILTVMILGVALSGCHTPTTGNRAVQQRFPNAQGVQPTGWDRRAAPGANTGNPNAGFPQTTNNAAVGFPRGNVQPTSANGPQPTNIYQTTHLPQQPPMPTGLGQPANPMSGIQQTGGIMPPPNHVNQPTTTHLPAPGASMRGNVIGATPGSVPTTPMPTPPGFGQTTNTNYRPMPPGMNQPMPLPSPPGY